MPASNFPNDPKPDYPIDETPAVPEVLISTHRDGSEQRRLKGAGKGRQFSLTFGAMPITQAQCEGFLAHYAACSGGLESFNWTHPERTTETYLVRYAEAPSFRLIGYDAYEGQVKLQEVPA